VVGVLCHQTIEAVLLSKKGAGELTTDEVLAELDRFQTTPDEGLVVHWSKILSLAKESLSRWVELWNRFFEVFEVESVEMGFTLPLKTNLPLVGRIDMVARSDDNSVWAVDWKTGQPNPKDQPQIEAYAVWVSEAHPTAAKVVAAVADIHNVSVRHRTLGPGALAATRSMLRTRATEVEGAFRNALTAMARPGAYCTDCPVLSDCPEGLGSIKPARMAGGVPSP
jgi:hypothetical protein